MLDMKAWTGVQKVDRADEKLNRSTATVAVQICVSVLASFLAHTGTMWLTHWSLDTKYCPFTPSKPLSYESEEVTLKSFSHLPPCLSISL